jgi:predicted dehydrogenase
MNSGIPGEAGATETRRSFLKSSGGAIAGSVAAPLIVPAFVHAGGSELLKLGLVGCGGRGTGAASQALRADPNVRLTAMADAFEDHLERSLVELRKDGEILEKIDVPRDRQFVGFDACQQLIDSGVDVVLLATPPHFRPQHLAAAIDAGKHVFAEKPVAVDAPGVRAVLATCEKAKRKRLSVVSGLCLRYSDGFRESIDRVHHGAIGEIRMLAANDYRGPVWTKERQPDWSDMEWQMRNWYYYTWLSGDFNVEQHVHFLDICTWLMRETYPVRCVGSGGRQVRTGPQFGHIYDHFAIHYEYDDGTRLISHCRQTPGCYNDMSVQALGTKGVADLSERRFAIRGDSPWARPGKDNAFYQTEHDELFASIRKGTPINNGDYMARSTLIAIMGRMAAYTGKQITWEMALNSKENLSPERYEWGPMPEPAVAIPGVTAFV